MTPAHWFSNFCPFFSVKEVESFNLKFPGHPLTPEKLQELGMAALVPWFRKHHDAWLKHLDLRQKTLDGIQRGEFQVISWGDPLYPLSLASLSFPPSLLFVRGDLHLFRHRCVAVVGARHPSELGRLWVQSEIKKLASREIIIVSGGARGIDAEAHEAALDCGGRTIVFLPGCVTRPYPVSHAYLFERILCKGALISECPPGTPVRPESFHRRNRLIAGAAEVVVIVEAGIKSGTMMTASKALCENREILVVPGPPLVASYGGSLELISQGAGLARDAEDIINSLNQKNVLK